MRGNELAALFVLRDGPISDVELSLKIAAPLNVTQRTIVDLERRGLAQRDGNSVHITESGVQRVGPPRART